MIIYQSINSPFMSGHDLFLDILPKMNREKKNDF